ncbi:MAG: iron-sulfur cluster carrier protein ApbC [Gammaproteobacteria bacterium]|nr:iron-sulfur cluster carrier protein ApbC [Gammaproteobacteria bacterium]MBT8110253.1 iron-sulfur cluster carrier protein ApbC [Gammaproteobacteria bacterium]NND48173.1 iron-sulfur cluster carrier protein ApbC [Woeseiaceae bacterium]NNL44956.1 iron-sulfur cluster carrier protein ApbC [Woeseiaceae bacterium]
MPIRRGSSKTASFLARLRYNVPPNFRPRPVFRTQILPNAGEGSVTVSTESDVSKFLNSIELSVVGRKLGEVARIRDSSLSGDLATATIELGFPCSSAHEAIGQQISDAVRAETGAAKVEIELQTRITRHGVQNNLKPIPSVKNVIAVASGKGGVGKSTVAANIALALSAEGASVGILDADIYGPSQPHMMGIVGQQPATEDGKFMLPLRAHGLQVMSMGALINPDEPMIWRGPMVTSALSQLTHQTKWEDLDYLIVDMPPGTGDIQLTLAQQVPVSGAVIITTPQNIAAIDARKGLAMFRKVSVPVLGVIENMSTHVCSQCGHLDAVFGEGGADKISRDFDVRLLGRLPLDARIRVQTDSGQPTVVAEPGSAIATAFREVAWQIGAALAAERVDHSSKFGTIVVEEQK